MKITSFFSMCDQVRTLPGTVNPNPEPTDVCGEYAANDHSCRPKSPTNPPKEPHLPPKRDLLRRLLLPAAAHRVRSQGSPTKPPKEPYLPPKRDLLRLLRRLLLPAAAHRVRSQGQVLPPNAAALPVLHCRTYTRVPRHVPTNKQDPLALAAAARC